MQVAKLDQVRLAAVAAAQQQVAVARRRQRRVATRSRPRAAVTARVLPPPRDAVARHDANMHRRTRLALRREAAKHKQLVADAANGRAARDIVRRRRRRRHGAPAPRRPTQPQQAPVQRAQHERVQGAVDEREPNIAGVVVQREQRIIGASFQCGHVESVHGVLAEQPAVIAIDDSLRQWWHGDIERLGHTATTLGTSRSGKLGLQVAHVAEHKRFAKRAALRVKDLQSGQPIDADGRQCGRVKAARHIQLVHDDARRERGEKLRQRRLEPPTRQTAVVRQIDRNGVACAFRLHLLDNLAENWFHAFVQAIDSL